MKLKDIMPIKKEENYNLSYTHIHQKSVGYMGYICPSCNHVNKIYVAYKYTIKSPNPIYFVDSKLEVICEECNKSFESSIIGIDPNIISVIETLNKLGYKTDFSCEGHVYSNGNISRPYVRFTDSRAIEKYGSPKDWIIERDLDDDSGSTAIYYNESIDNNGRLKQKALGLLEDWVRSFEEFKSEEEN